MDMNHPPKRRIGMAAAVFVLISCVYALTFSGSNIEKILDQKVRFATTYSIVEQGKLSLPYDMKGLKGVGGKEYSWYGIGQPVLAIPFYLAGKMIGGIEGSKSAVSLMNLLAVSLSGAVLFLFILNLNYSPKTALVVTAFYAFGTMAWPQSKHPWDHPEEMLFLLLSLFFIQYYLRTKALTYLLLSSLALGVAFTTRVPTILALVPILIYLVMERHDARRSMQDVAIFTGAFTPFVLIQLWYNHARFGSIFETGLSLMAQRAGIDFFSGTPLHVGLQGLLVSPGKGFFLYAPITILFFFSIRGFFRRHKGLACCLAAIAMAYVGFIAKNIYWHGDWSWGPRYIFVITPLLMIPVAEFVEKGASAQKRLSRGLWIGLFVVSVVVQLIGISIDFNRYFYSLQAEKGVRFKVVGGNDCPQILEPPDAVHFQWSNSPLLYNAKTILALWDRVQDSAPGQQKTKTPGRHDFLSEFNRFDFWWAQPLP